MRACSRSCLWAVSALGLALLGCATITEACDPPPECLTFQAHTAWCAADTEAERREVFAELCARTAVARDE